MKKQKILLVCSTGGHLSQMLKIADELNDYNYFFDTYESTVSSDVSKGYFIKSRFTNCPNIGAIVLLMITTLIMSIKILYKEKPNIIITTGSGEIAIPFCYLGKLFGSKIIYIETLSRIATPSTGGKVIYPVADLFLVQWESLLEKYGEKAKFLGRVI